MSFINPSTPRPPIHPFLKEWVVKEWVGRFETYKGGVTIKTFSPLLHRRKIIFVFNFFDLFTWEYFYKRSDIYYSYVTHVGVHGGMQLCSACIGRYRKIENWHFWQARKFLFFPSMLPSK